ncbi:MAG: hypothetical protein OXC95_08560 [Dehalococcoidia bacterium]|nr:hypothetical protein [Dehalococcoidia bacterium]
MIARPQETVASLLHDSPRRGAIANILAFASVDGLILCTLIGAIVAWGTSNFISDKLWIYVANTAIAMLAKVVWAWLWVAWGRALVIRIALLITQKRFGETPNIITWPEGLPDQANRTVLIVTVATALATILATEEFNPTWVSEPIHIVWITGLAGALTAAMESLSVPSNIQALWKNKHNYQQRANHLHEKRR